MGMVFGYRKIDSKSLPENVVAKWSREFLDEGFVPLPKRLLRSFQRVPLPCFGLEHLALILAVADFRRPVRSWPPTLEFLAMTAGLTEARFKELLGELEQHKLITVSGTEQRLEVNIKPFIDSMVLLTNAAKDGTESETAGAV